MRRNLWLARLDFYAKVPIDLLEGSREGNIVSLIAIFVICTLLFRETQQFFTPKLVKDLSLDSAIPGETDKLEVNFNITMMDLKCDFATINVVSVLGNQQNITKDIKRWNLDADGVRKQYAQRNPDQQDVVHFDPSVTESLERLHENGEDAVMLTPETIDYALEDFEFVFIDFFASWCSHCRDLAPTWEKFAEVMHDVEDKLDPNLADYDEEEYEAAKKLEMPVLVAKVDCVEYEELCDDWGVDAYPTLMLYVNGNDELGGEYDGDRTIVGFLHAVMEIERKVIENPESRMAVKEHAEIAMKKHLDMSLDHAEWLKAIDRSRLQRGVWKDEEHPGCLLTGTLFMKRVPGRFFIQADGKAGGYNLHPGAMNLSHEVHHLSFRKVNSQAKRGEVLPANVDKSFYPFDGNVYVTEELREAHHHYIKLVSTSSEYYQVLQNSQVAYYHDGDRVPEAKFVLDISPIAVRYRWRHRPWYDYVTSVLAIVGGTFTVLGMFESCLYLTSKQVTKRRKKPAAGGTIKIAT